MNSITRKRKAPRRLALASVIVGLLLAAQGAQAGMPVMDIPGLVNAIQNFLVTGAQYKKEVQQWKSLKEDAKIGQALGFQLGLPAGLKLDPVPDGYLVAETCGKELTGWRLMDLLDLEKITDQKEKQYHVCMNIQLVKNQKFNETVIFLDKTLGHAETIASAISSKRDESDSSGNVQSASSDVDRFNSQLTVKVQQWEARMKSYDAYLDVMQSHQNQLAKAALKGDLGKTIIGDVGQSIALKHALDLD